MTRPAMFRPAASRRRARVTAAVLALGLVLTGGGAAQAWDWPRDPALRPAPEAEVSTVDAEAAIATKLGSLLAEGGLGKAYSLRVVDVESGRVVADRLGTKARIAASSTKLFTAVAALDVLGKNRKFTTKVK
ncbi:MAG: hypothetical protein GX593_12975, partial [Actinomycetales bacterium]|nr:hypothetical protein [Actinomycetales bacterium]